MKTLILPLALAAIAATAPASAHQQIDVQTTRIDVSDLDLGSARDQAKLHRRVEFAISRVCDEPGARSTEIYAQMTACKDQARRRAQQDVTRIASAVSAGGAHVAVAEPQQWP